MKCRGDFFGGRQQNDMSHGGFLRGGTSQRETHGDSSIMSDREEFWVEASACYIRSARGIVALQFIVISLFGVVSIQQQNTMVNKNLFVVEFL